MKSYYSILLLWIGIYYSTFSYAQDFPNIATFIELRTQKNEVLEEKLTSIQMELYDEYEIKNGYMQYTYQPVTFSTALPQWVDLIYVKNAYWNNRLSFQLGDINLVLKKIEELKALQFTLVAKKIVDRQIYDIYTDGTTIVELVTSEDRKYNNFYYNFMFYNKEEYDYAFAEENAKYIIPTSKPTNTYANMVGLSIIKE